MRIRRATSEDAGPIAAIHVSSSRAAYRGLLPEEVHQAFTVEHREKAWREILATGDADVWIADEGGRDVGRICVGTSRDRDAEPSTAEVRAMYIEPDAWRRGIGRALWGQAEASLRAVTILA
jgi:GNAT superfamily N-acetyltransferase